MTQIPYQPWPVERKSVSIDDMNRILANRTKGKVMQCGHAEEAGATGNSVGISSESAGVSVSAENTPLVWSKPVWTNPEKTAGYMLSECGRYSVDKASGVYTSWLRATRSAIAESLGCKNDINEAKTLCQAHVDGERRS